MTGPHHEEPAVWFPAIRAGTGIDVFTERLAAALERHGIRSEISWLPHHAEYAPWLVRPPRQPDWANLVHCNSWLHPRLLAGRLPVVATLHSCVHDPALAPYKSRSQALYHRHWVARLERGILARADEVTAVSDYTARRATAVFGRQGIRTIHNWIECGLYRPAPRRPRSGPLRLLFVGNLNARKGADLLPEIMRRLGDDFVLHYTGTPKEFSSRLMLPANMAALGRLHGDPALVAAYQGSDALLFPTRLEGFGLAALEAQACGLPVIASRNSSIPEVIQDGEGAILCPTDDIDAFVRAVARLRDETGLWERMSEAAVQQARFFSEQAAVTRYIDVYRGVLRPRP
jgi:glycosyltransferase involved in cell wall biosynthesis